MPNTLLDHAPADAPGNAILSTTEALQRLAFGRDGEAWSAILQRHGPAIYRVAFRITNDRALCEDVCQETLLQIRAHAGRFTPPAAAHEAEAAARGWVMCIAYRTAVGMLRVRSRRSRNEEQAGMEQLALLPEAQDPALSSEQLAIVRSEVARLPELLRSAVCLHFYGELSYPELSETLGCNEKAARKRVERGVQKLRSRLAGAGVAVGAAALAAALGGSAHACEALGVAVTAASAATAAPVSEALNLARLAEWQTLLNHPATPLLASVAKVGGTAIMTKYIVTTAALLAFALSGVQTYRMSSLSSELSAAREQAGGLQDRVGELEKMLAKNRGDTEALKASLSARNDTVTQLEEKVKDVQSRSNSTYGFTAYQVPTPQPTQWVENANDLRNPGQPQSLPKNLMIYREAQLAGAPDMPVAPGYVTVEAERAMALDRMNKRLTQNKMQMPPDTIVKYVDPNTIEYTTPEGKILQRFQTAPAMTGTSRSTTPGMGSAMGGGGPAGFGGAPGAMPAPTGTTAGGAGIGLPGAGGAPTQTAPAPTTTEVLKNWINSKTNAVLPPNEVKPAIEAPPAPIVKINPPPPLPPAPPTPSPAVRPPTPPKLDKAQDNF